MDYSTQHIHFVTGRLAETAVRHQVASVAARLQFDYSIHVLPITVAALMTPKWLARHLRIPPQATRVLLPGHLSNELTQLQENLDPRIECGPRDIRDLPTFFQENQVPTDDYGAHSIEILAEINHADRLPIASLIDIAQQLNVDGADVIDLGCSPAHRWHDVGRAVQELVDRGLRVSIDSFDEWEVAQACRAGAELVLSVNSSNRAAAVDWQTEVVVLPDAPNDEKSLDETINFLIERDISFRLDPILEPLGCGLSESLQRYARCRKRYPEANMLMGIGNITELTDVDSAGANVILMGLCQEIGIQSVLTTQVINWARSSVRECDLARRLMYFACQHHIPPKHIEPKLVVLRDTRVKEHSDAMLESLRHNIRDKNVRLFNQSGQIHAISAGVHVAAPEPFEVMRQLLASTLGPSIDREHAFYLGFEMAKALTALTLGKQYDQDQPLDWGYLTAPETDVHALPHRRRGAGPAEEASTH